MKLAIWFALSLASCAVPASNNRSAEVQYADRLHTLFLDSLRRFESDVPVEPLNEAEYTGRPADGNGAIDGQAFLRNRGGEVRYAAGCTIHLDPATPYAQSMVRRRVHALTALTASREVSTIIDRGTIDRGCEEMDRRTAPFHKETVADGDGRFRFDGLPAGDYVVWSAIFWDVYAGQDGGIAHAIVTVRDGETAKAIASK